MKRPLFFSLLAFLAGIYGAHFLSVSLGIWVAVPGVLLLILALCKKLSPLYAVLCFCCLAGVFCLQMADSTEDRALYPYVNEYVTLSGHVIEEPEVNPETGRATVLTEVYGLSFLEEEISCKEKIRLTLRAGETVPPFGSCFRAICLLEVPERGSGGFDFELYLKSREIYFLGMVEEGTMEIIGSFSPDISERIYQLNRRTGRVLKELLPLEEASVLQAISLGDKTDMPAELYDALKVSGLTHVTAVSGMHVTTFLMIVYALLLMMKQNKNRFLLPLIGLVLLFMLFTGCSPSVVRASVMCILSMVAYLCYRKEDPLTSLGIAGGLIALVNPFLVFDVGFMLSFGATFGILVFARSMTECLRARLGLERPEGFFSKGLAGILNLLCVSASAQLLLLPLAAWIFGYVSLWTFLTTLLVTPLLPVLLIGGLLVGFLGLIHPWLTIPVIGIVYLYAKVFVWIARFFGSLSFGVMPLVQATLSGAYLYLLFIIGFYFVLKKKWNKVICCGGVCICLITVFLILSACFPAARITFINVGQGDCSLIRLPGRETILLDGGGQGYETEYDVGQEVVLPYLRRQGVRRLSYLIASHPHADHIGGLFAVVENMPVETVVLPKGFCDLPDGAAFAQLAVSKGIAVRYLSGGDSLELGNDAVLECLLPDGPWLSRAENENDHSLVCRLRFGESTVLFPGDLESGGEAYLTETVPAEAVDILKVPHHGSETSSGAEFLMWAEPAYAFIPCGKNNFGHPADSVLRRLSDTGTVVYRGDYDKHVTLMITKTGVRSVRTEGEKP